MSDITLTTMVMIQHPATGEVLVQDRLSPRFPGYAFPGGHVDDGESICGCAVREIKEETGLDVCDLKPCGIVHYCRGDTQDRYFVFLFKTSNYSGELIAGSEEGRHFWMPLDALKKHKFTNRFGDYLPMFLGEYCEAFCSYSCKPNSAGTDFVFL